MLGSDRQDQFINIMLSRTRYCWQQ